MLKECIKTGSTVDEAKAAALLELGLSEYDDYHTEVLKAPVKKTLGIFGGSPAEVKITVEVPDAKEEKQPAAEMKKPAKDNSVKENKKTEAPKQEKTPAVSEEKKKDSLKPTDEYKSTADYIKSVILGLGMEKCEVSVLADDDEIVFELDCGDDYGIVIGRRGETLDAIQYLARMVANRGAAGYKRVSINVGNYREKRAAVLVSLAKKTAVRAVKTGRNIALEPMNPYERRIIHTAVQEVKGATSFSTGVDLDRRVVIAPEDGGKGTYTQNDRYDRSRGGSKGGYNRNDRDRRPKREPYVPQVNENRERKDDAAGMSVYGKIEVKKDEE